MKKKVIVILAEGFEEIEAVTIIDILRRAGVEVISAGESSKEIRGSHEIKITADIRLEEIEGDFDACVLPGGMPGATHLGTSEKVGELVKKMANENKLVAAICASPAVALAPLGILKNKKATCYPGMQKQFDEDTTYLADKVVIDENIITGRGPGTAIEFSLKIIERLIGSEASSKIRKSVLAN